MEQQQRQRQQLQKLIIWNKIIRRKIKWRSLEIKKFGISIWKFKKKKRNFKTKNWFSPSFIFSQLNNQKKKRKRKDWPPQKKANLLKVTEKGWFLFLLLLGMWIN